MDNEFIELNLSRFSKLYFYIESKRKYSTLLPFIKLPEIGNKSVISTFKRKMNILLAIFNNVNSYYFKLKVKVKMFARNILRIMFVTESQEFLVM